MNNSTIRLYNLLISKNFNQEEAASFIEEVEATVTKKFENNVNVLVTKDDLAREITEVKRDISKLTDTVHNQINNLFWKMTGVILAQMGLIFTILKFVGVFD